MLTTDVNLNGGANQAVIRQAFLDRGILESGPTGVVAFESTTYSVGDTVTISVSDSDLLGGGPIVVNVVSSGGDTESVTLTEVAGEFVGTISTSGGTVLTASGILEL